MNLPLVLEPEVDEAYAWYQRQREGLAEEFLAEIQQVLDRIRQNPELHAAIYRNVRRALVRRLSYVPFTIGLNQSAFR